jgi:hypothetical protein
VLRWHGEIDGEDAGIGVDDLSAGESLCEPVCLTPVIFTGMTQVDMVDGEFEGRVFAL